MLAGRGGLDFAEAVAITNADGEPLTNLDITDHEDQRIPLNICTHQHAVDYDGDVDLDVVVGCFGSHFYLHENTGGEDESSFSGAAQELPVRSPSHHTAPHLVDWDGDGDLDLLSGTADGGAIISHNTGSRSQPEWSNFQQLIEPAPQREQVLLDGNEVHPSSSTRIWATDWNRDGLLDLLVGDCVELARPAKGVTRAEFERRRAEFPQRIAAISQKYADLMERYQKALQEARKSKGQIDLDLQAKVGAMEEERRQVWESRAEYQETESTGFIWLYLRMASDRVAAAER